MATNSFLFHQTFSLIIVIASAYLGFLVYFSGKKETTNKLFFVMAIGISFWIGFYYLTISQASIVWCKMAYATVSVVYLFFYLFFIYFLKFEKRLKRLTSLVVIVSSFFFFASLFTDLIVKDVILKNGWVDLLLGPAKASFYGTAIFLSFLVISLLLFKYFKFSQKEKSKIQYFLIGVIGWLLMNFVFNMVLPLWRGSVQFSEFGNYSAIILLAFTSYAIMKRELFDIKIILTGIFISMIAFLLFVDILLFTDIFWIRISKIISLVIFVFFGYYLIQSVIREIQQRERLERLASELEKANAELRKLDASKTEFISIASHQLRTPLTAIKGYLSMIDEGNYGELPEGVKGKVKNIFESNERLIKLVNDLLNVSRIETGKLELEKSDIDVKKFLSQAVHDLLINAEEKNIYLKLVKPKEKIIISADEKKIRQSFLNILDNAIKYTNKGGVTVKVKTSNNYLTIEIIDTGEGMSKEELAKVFERFSRGNAGNWLHGEGAGLGLYIARKFIEMHRGEVWADSKGQNKGSQFYIKIPLN